MTSKIVVYVTNKRLEDGSITLDQTEYLSALKPINPKHYANLKKDDQCTEHLRALSKEV